MAEVEGGLEAASLRAQLNSREMSRAQWEVVLLCTAINMLDGYDVLVMSFAAAPVAADWQLDPARLGLLLSAGLIGMALGSIVLGSLADALGRKRLVNICLITVTIGMILSAYTQSQLQLLALRFVTGVGIGGMLATLTALVSEYSNDKRRGICMGLLQSGYPLGALFGGMIAAKTSGAANTAYIRLISRPASNMRPPAKGAAIAPNLPTPIASPTPVTLDLAAYNAGPIV